MWKRLTILSDRSLVLTHSQSSFGTSKVSSGRKQDSKVLIVSELYPIASSPVWAVEVMQPVCFTHLSTTLRSNCSAWKQVAAASNPEITLHRLPLANTVFCMAATAMSCRTKTDKPVMYILFQQDWIILAWVLNTVTGKTLAEWPTHIARMEKPWLPLTR